MANKRVYFDFPSNNPIVDNAVPKLSWLQWFQRIQFIAGEPKVWKDVLSQRSLGVPYVNGTGRPISINIRATSTVAMSIVVVFGNGVVVAGAAQNVVGLSASVYVEIPNGETYTVTVAGVPTVNQWSEYS